MIHDVVVSLARLVPASGFPPGVAAAIILVSAAVGAAMAVLAAVVLLVPGIERPPVCRQKARLFAGLVAVAVCPALAAPCTMAGVWLGALLRRAL